MERSGQDRRADCQRRDLLISAIEECIGSNDQSVNALPFELRESQIDLALLAEIFHPQFEPAPLRRGPSMTLRTGTSKSGTVHKYYDCSTCARQDKTGCKGRLIPMAKLDTLVTDHLVDRLFRPERLTAILASIVAERAERARSGSRIANLQTEISNAEDKPKRLYKKVEDGLTDLDEVLKRSARQSETGSRSRQDGSRPHRDAGRWPVELQPESHREFRPGHA